jgi:hypothetical protein
MASPGRSGPSVRPKRAVRPHRGQATARSLALKREQNLLIAPSMRAAATS